MLRDVNKYEKMQEALALLKILTMSRKNLEDGKIKPFRVVFRDVRKKAVVVQEK